MRVQLYIENQLLDLFNDESIELNSSVANVSDISKQSGDYTKTFTVPASDRNNAIFKHYYNADIDNTFDARTKKNARIELDGMPFRDGKARLELVAEKDGRPSSYTIIFWGAIVNFKGLLKEDLLSSLNLSAYNHAYNYTNVRNGLITGLFDGNIIYTLLSQRRQFMYSSDPDDNTDTDKLVNIAYNGEDRGIVWSDLKPSIRLLTIIEAIEAKYGLTFSREFFGRTEFEELYMWLNSEEIDNYTEQLINWTSGNATDFGLNLSTNLWTVTDYDTFYNMKYRLEVTPASGYENVKYKIVAKNITTGSIVMSVEATGNFTTDIVNAIDPPFQYAFYVYASATFEYTADLLLRGFNNFGHLDRSAHANSNSITDIFDISAALPNMKIMDFLKGLFNMFKLVAIPDAQNNVYVNNIDDYYREGVLHDVSNWIDASKKQVARVDLFNNIKFGYQDPTTILNMQFKKIFGEAYGDEQLTLNSSDGELLDGQALDIIVPFELVLFERLRNIFTNGYTNIQYGLITDENIEEANPKAVIFYNNRVDLGVTNISLLNQTGETTQVNGTINTPSHSLGFDSPQYNILWGAENSTWNGARMDNNLFTNYWQSYIQSIYNVKRRNIKFSAILPIKLLLKLKLNDILKIKDNYYRINDFTVDLTTRVTTMNLMNTFETNFGLFAPSQSRVILSSVVQSYGVNVSNGSTMNIEKQEIGGMGTGWASVTQSGYNLIITVTENSGTDARSMFINVDNGAGKSFQILLIQNEP